MKQHAKSDRFRPNPQPRPLDQKAATVKITRRVFADRVKRVISLNLLWPQPQLKIISRNKTKQWPRAIHQWSTTSLLRIMKSFILVPAALIFLVACDNRPAPPTSEKVVEKNTTIINPPATQEKKVENNTTIINPPPAPPKEDKK